MSTQPTQCSTPALFSLSLNRPGEGRPLNPQLCSHLGKGRSLTPPVLEQTPALLSHLSPSSYCEHSVLGILYWIYIKYISFILFVTDIRSKTINNTGVLQSIYILKPILKELWRLLEMLINQCNKKNRLLFLKRCFTYREDLWQNSETRKL